MSKEFAKLLKVFNASHEILKDKRISEVISNATNFQINSFTTLEKWEEHKKKIKNQILVASGFWAEIPKNPLNTKIIDCFEVEDIKIQKVIFESMPGFYVTGNLYTPKETAGKIPAILNPHGHWDEGRMEASEITNIPLRCANFAKMGFAAFSYDMVGYCDSTQLEHVDSTYEEEEWGFGILGLQLLNSIRSIDFLESLDYVDSTKIGCTGASGGGTQTFLLAAVDERIKAAMPVNIVSNTYQGGCCCEHAPLLRIGTNNVEISAAMAPRAQLLVGCTGDWTINLEKEVYPAIKNIYSLYGQQDMVEYYLEDAPHNYNKNAREVAYKWFSRHLLGKEQSWSEQLVELGNLCQFRIDLVKEMGLESASRKDIFEKYKEMVKAQWEKLWDGQPDTAIRHFKDGWRIVTGVHGISQRVHALFEKKVEFNDLYINKVVIGTDYRGEQIPVALINKKDITQSNEAIIMLHPQGKQALAEDECLWNIALQHLNEGITVVCPDLFCTGEYNTPYANCGRDYTGNNIDNPWYNCTRKVYFSTYNHSDTALKIQDIVTVWLYLQQQGLKQVKVKGFEIAGLWALAAAPFIDGVEECEEADNVFLPCNLSAGGFEGCRRFINIDA